MNPNTTGSTRFFLTFDVFPQINILKLILTTKKTQMYILGLGWELATKSMFPTKCTKS
ncbi:hypothetical protein Hanom_Chr14g01311441 [Helianthus anomalus]